MDLQEKIREEQLKQMINIQKNISTSNEETIIKNSLFPESLKALADALKRTKDIQKSVNPFDEFEPTNDIEKANREELTGGRWVTVDGNHIYLKNGEVAAGQPKAMGGGQSEPDYTPTNHPEEDKFRGKTKSGKEYDVRRTITHDEYKDFTSEDHKEAAAKHSEMMKETSGEQNTHHNVQSTLHDQKSKEVVKKDDLLSKLNRRSMNTTDGLVDGVRPDEVYSALDLGKNPDADKQALYDKVQSASKMVTLENKSGGKGMQVWFTDWNKLKDIVDTHKNSGSDKKENKPSEMDDEDKKSVQDKVDYFKELDEKGQKEYIDTLKNKWIPETKKQAGEAKGEASKKIYSDLSKFLEGKLLPAIEKEGISVGKLSNKDLIAQANEKIKEVNESGDKLKKDGYNISRATYQDKPMIRIAYPDGRISAQPDKGQSLEEIHSQLYKPEKKEVVSSTKPIELTGKETKDDLVKKLVSASPHFENENSKWDSDWSYRGKSKPDLQKLVKIYNTNIGEGGKGNISEFRNDEAYAPNRELQQKVADYLSSIGHPLDKIPKETAKKMDADWKDYVEKEHGGWLGHTKEEKEKAFNRVKQIMDSHLK